MGLARFQKHALAPFPCLGIIQRDGQLIVDTDACDVAIGAVLHQVQVQVRAEIRRCFAGVML